MFEDMKGLAFILNDQSPVLEDLELFGVGLWRFVGIHPLPP
jgi:hypothetical protein